MWCSAAVISKDVFVYRRMSYVQTARRLLLFRSAPVENVHTPAYSVVTWEYVLKTQTKDLSIIGSSLNVAFRIYHHVGLFTIKPSSNQTQHHTTSCLLWRLSVISTVLRVFPCPLENESSCTDKNILSTSWRKMCTYLPLLWTSSMSSEFISVFAPDGRFS